MDQIKMGKFIKELRQEKGLTQKEISDKLNITDNSISIGEYGTSMKKLILSLNKNFNNRINIK